MLPRSCFLLADSKSNSSMRLPLRTTTRVSSGCDASMSILLLDMANSVREGAHAEARRVDRRRKADGRSRGVERGAPRERVESRRPRRRLARPAGREGEAGSGAVAGRRVPEQPGWGGVRRWMTGEGQGVPNAVDGAAPQAEADGRDGRREGRDGTVATLERSEHDVWTLLAPPFDAEALPRMSDASPRGSEWRSIEPAPIIAGERMPSGGARPSAAGRS